MRILKPGQNVTLREGQPGEKSTQIEAMLTRVNISLNMGILYECGWWDNRVRYERWFYGSEIIEPVDAQYLEISACEEARL